MNAAFLIMSSAVLAGADPAPPPPPPAAPAVISPGAGCNNCGAPAAYYGPSGDCCGSSKPGLFDRFKSRFGGHGRKSHDCGCAPAPACAPTCAPACPAPPPPPCNTCNTCNTCDRPNLLDKVKAWCAGRKNRNGPCCNPCPPPCAPVCDPCAVVPGAPLPGVPGQPGVPPKEMPKPKDKVPEKPPEKPKDKGNTTSAPQPLPVVPGAREASPY